MVEDALPNETAILRDRVIDLENRLAQAQAALRKARTRVSAFARFPEQNPNPVARASAEGLVLYHNQAAASMPGWTCVLDQPLPAPFDSLVKQAMAGRRVVQEDLALSGRYYWVFVVPIAEENYANLYGRDITLRKQAERNLEESRHQLTDILKSLGDGLLALDRDWTIRYVNRYAAEVAGKPAEALVGNNLWELWPELLGTPLASCYRQAMEAGISGQLRVQGSQTGRCYDVSVYPSTEGITIFYIDKTEQMQAEAARVKLLEENQQQHEFLESVLESDPSGIAVFTKDDLRFQFANRAYRGLLPMGGQEPVGKTLEEVWPSSLGFQVLRTYLPDMQGGEPVQFERISRQFPDGSMRHFSVHIHPMSWQGRPANLVVAWETTQLEIAKAELQDYAEKLKRSNEDLQEFALIASHDLQEPLRKIQTFGDLLMERASALGERDRNYVQRMQNAAGRMREMVEGLLQLSRVTTQGKQFQAVDLAALAAEVLSDLNHQVRRTGGTVELGPLPIVQGDPLQLRQLLQNLIGNGLKFHARDVPPRVKVGGRQLATSIEIRVADEGIGFDQEHAERIFQPFQRLVARTEYEGSGMGLAICRRIVERHGGEIHAVSKPGKGTIFVVSLPARPTEPAANEPGRDAQHE